MLKHKSILQFQEPKHGEPLCSGPELTLNLGQRIDLAHFHTVVTVTFGQPRGLLSLGSTGVQLACIATINGREYDRQNFAVSRDEIGKTLFCAGFPCVTVTGMDEENGTVMLTQSEIVELCEPGTCPWGED
jgi:hypothetical protein